MPRRRPKPHYIINLLLSASALGLFAMTGIRVSSTTSAATANPYGSIDYCALENNTTVVYGWAADPDSTSLAQPAVQLEVAGRQSSTMTNRANYRDNYLQKWIATNHSGDPQPGTYGFKIALPGLFKGSLQPISGTVLNEGPGSSTILPVNNSAPINGDTNKPFFADNLIPEPCLADPAVAQSSTPTVASTLSQITPIPKTAASQSAGAVAVAGTLAAEVRIKTDSAKTVSVSYGKSPVSLDQNTSDVPVTSAETAVMLTGLQAGQSYAYRVIRTDTTGKKSTSPLGTFDTLGFVIALHIVDNRDTGIQGIAVTLSGQKQAKTTDDNGDVQFLGVPTGTASFSYQYLGKTFTRSISATSTTVKPAEAAQAKVITLDNNLNIQAASGPTTVAPASQRNDTMLLIIPLIVTVMAIGLIVGAIVYRKKRRVRQVQQDFFDTPAPPLPEYQPIMPVMPPVVRPDGAEHMGQSLKDMVVKDLQHSTYHNHR